MYAHRSVNISVCIEDENCCQELVRRYANSCQFRCIKNTCLRKKTKIDQRICTRAFPLQRQVFQTTITLQFCAGSLRIALSCASQRPHVPCFKGKLIIFEGQQLQETRKRRSRAQSAAHPPHTGLQGSICRCKYAAGSPA
jgi:hypothetical protein